MTRLLTNHIATMTEMREPHKVLERSGGKPVAILRNSALVGYLVPEDATGMDKHERLPKDRLREILERTRAGSQPVLDYLKDK
jgi:antitoxin StbD